MQFPKPHSLQTRFFIGLCLAALVLGSIFSVVAYFHLRSVLEREVEDKARLFFTHLEGIQNYVRKTLRPAMYERFPATFIIEAMSSSYISREIMSPFSAPKDGSLFRRVAVGARNPEYEANELERQLIGYFQEDPSRRIWQGYRPIEGKRHFIMARPVRFEQSCLYCHGRAEDAPPDLLKIYGMRGFGKRLDSIAGLDFVATSMEQAAGGMRQSLLTYFAFFASSVLLIFFATHVLFRVLVVNKLSHLREVFHRHASGEERAALQQFEDKDEISKLVDGIESMGEHLFEARRQLQDYAGNLRRMVEERTAALSRESQARRADVQLFVSLLQDMAKSRSRPELWRRALPQVCGRFQARRIAYLCTMASTDAYVWPESAELPEKPGDFVEILTSGTARRQGATVFIPVGSSAAHAEGLLFLDWPDEEKAAEHDLKLLQALGQQLGIVAENISALDGLARQMNILETIVEGISDPLVLMDSACSALTVNMAAKKLTSELSGGTRGDGNILAPFFNLGSGLCPLRYVRASGRADFRELSLLNRRSFSISLYPVQDQSGTVAHVVVFLRETTMERHLQAQMLRTEKMASVGRFTAGLAHEINNPLGVIRCYTDLLRQAISDPQQLDDLQVIERHTRQAQRVLRDLLNFARPKTAGSVIADAGQVVQSVSEVFSVQAAQKGVRITVQHQEPGPLARLGIGELEQVLSNLIINALDAVSEEKGEIVITVAAGENGMIAIEVADNGPGIPGDDVPQLFDPFFTTKDIGAGTGLGLSISYSIVNDAGGSIEIGRSQQLGGASFTIMLPRVQPD